MKMRHNRIARGAALLLSLLLCGQLAVPASAAPADRPGTIYIGTAEELRELARGCVLDSWSRDKVVVLTGDISLADVELTPIPSFGGTFDGGGHTLSGLTLSGSLSPIGLFGTLQPGAVVKNLDVRGSVSPRGARDMAGGIVGVNNGTVENCSFTGTVTGGNSVGGLVGLNNVTGTIRDCKAGGSITGKSMTGGIAGKNLGVISGCSNSAFVNITSVDPGLDLSELDLGSAASLGSLRALDTVNVATDTGGIAGYSGGMVLSCVNLAVIGYQHIGYNVGGIAGRSCGHIANCENRGAILGRKDIGGIVGQAEPDIVLNLSADQVDGLRRNLDRLGELVDDALDDSQSSGSDLSQSLDAIGGTIDRAAGYAEDLSGQLSRFGDSTVSEVNRGSGILADAVGRLNAMSGDITGLSETFSDSLEALSAALDGLSEAGPYGGQALEDLLAASEALREAGGPLKRGVQQINSGVDLLQGAVTVKDRAKIEAAGRQISGGLSDLSRSADSASKAFEDLSGALDRSGLSGAADAAQRLSTAGGKMAGGLRQMGSGAQALLDSVVIEDQAAVDAALAQLREGAQVCAQAAQEIAAAAAELAQALRDSSGGEADAALQKLQEAGSKLSGGIGQVDAALAVLEQNISVDDGKAQAGLESIRAGLGELTQGADEASKALDSLNAALREANVDRVLDALGELSGALSRMTGALERISRGAQTIQDNIAVDADAASAGVDAIQAGADTLLTALEAMDQAADSLESAIRNVQQGAGQLDPALESLADAVDSFQGASEQGTGILRQAESLFEYLNGVDPIQITYPGDEIDAAADGLFGAVNQISGQLNGLNGQMSSMSATLGSDLRAISAQVRLTMDDLLDAISEAENSTNQETVSDTSEEDIDAVTSGKVLSCVNCGQVNGDINVGGVAGAMAVEYELDPEGDLSTDAPIYRREYELKAILQKCVNRGTVTSRRDCAGGVCGRVELGLVTRCEGYGTIASESGDYVGGVAGFSGGAVRDSFAKCWLSGGDYVGGITGAAAAGNAGGAVSRCCSLVRVTGHGQYAGAISGGSQGTFQDNYFVSDTLAGLDQVSIAGQAQAVDYAQMLQLEGLPKEFTRLTLRFLAQGAVVKELKFNYGDSFGPEVFPDIPPQEGCFSAWDTQDLSALRFDTDVTAVYTPYLTALASGGKRDDGRPVFLAEGLFSGQGEFDAERTRLPDGQTSGLSGLTFLSRRTLLEVWTLDGTARTIRYLSPSGNGEGLELYVLEPAGWVRLETKTAGSYLTAQVPASPVTIAAVSRTSVWWILILTALLVLAVVSLAAAGVIRRRKKGKPDKEAREMDDAAARGGAPEPPEVLPEVGNGTSAAGKKRRKRLFMALIVLAAALAAGAAVFFATGLKDDAAAYALLRRYIGKNELTAGLSVDIRLGDSRHHMDTTITKTQVEGKSVTCAEQYGATVYYCGGLLYLENGQAIEAGELAPNYPELLGGVFTLYKSSKITVFENQGQRIYRVSVDGDAARPILESLLPSALNYLTWVDLLDVSLVEYDGELSELIFDAGGTFTDSGETPVEVSAVLTAREDSGEKEIPSRVRDRIAEGDAAQAIAGDAVFRLLESWIGLNARDPLTADVSLSADCGPLVLNEDMVWTRTHTGGVDVNSIRKNGRTYYFSTGDVYDESGNKDSGAGTELFSPEDLLTLAYRLCVSGEVRSTENDGVYTYSLTLDGDGMADVAHAILPDTEELDLNFQSGSVQITVTDVGMEDIRFSCAGSVKLMVVDVPVSLRAGLHFGDPSEEGGVEIPDDVLAVLSGPPG